MQTKLSPVLIIAGSDPSGGAGIQADIKTCTALGSFATTAITASTVQNTLGVSDVLAMPPPHVAAQIHAVMADIPPKAIKLGMLLNTEIINAIAQTLKAYSPLPNIVLDPVMVATSGSMLLENSAIEALTTKLFPLTTLLTPNIPEAEQLCGFEINHVKDMEKAAQYLHETYNIPAILIKGGHLKSDTLTDVLLTNEKIYSFEQPHIVTKHTHGTGCSYASAITSLLAHGFGMVAAVREAQKFIHTAIAEAPQLGQGNGPINHLHQIVRKTVA